MHRYRDRGVEPLFSVVLVPVPVPVMVPVLYSVYGPLKVAVSKVRLPALRLRERPLLPSTNEVAER